MNTGDCGNSLRALPELAVLSHYILYDEFSMDRRKVFLVLLHLLLLLSLLHLLWDDDCVDIAESTSGFHPFVYFLFNIQPFLRLLHS